MKPRTLLGVSLQGVRARKRLEAQVPLVQRPDFDSLGGPNLDSDWGDLRNWSAFEHVRYLQYPSQGTDSGFGPDGTTK